MKTALVALCVLLLWGCTPKVTAASTCAKLEAAGVAKNCQPKPPGGLGAAAKEAVDFELPSVPGKGGQALAFESEDAYKGAVKTFEAASFLAGPHRYGNDKARIFVQLTESTPADVGAKAKAVVDGLLDHHPAADLGPF